MTPTQSILDALTAHGFFDFPEEKHRDLMYEFIGKNPSAWWKRSTLDGHVTASAWVLNSTKTHALLLHHAKLDRWLQPGGHVDDDDASLEYAALREAREETGINTLFLVDREIFDVDVHPIPARHHEPAHLHYDVRYLVGTRDEAVTLSTESTGFRWIPLAEIAGNAFASGNVRMARKAMLLSKK